MILIQEWMQETGLNLWELSKSDFFQRKMDDPDYAKLRTGHGHYSKKRHRETYVHSRYVRPQGSRLFTRGA